MLASFLLIVQHRSDAVTARTIDAETWIEAWEKAGVILREISAIRSIKLEIKSGLLRPRQVPTTIEGGSK